MNTLEYIKIAVMTKNSMYFFILTEMVNIRNDLENFSETESFPVISVGEIESALIKIDTT